MSFQRAVAGCVAFLFTITTALPSGLSSSFAEEGRSAPDALRVLNAGQEEATVRKDLGRALTATGQEEWPVVVALDGMAGSGKSTTARLLAERLEARHLSLGTLYRAVTWLAIEYGLDPTLYWDHEELNLLARRVRIGWLDGQMQVQYQPASGAPAQPIQPKELDRGRVDAEVHKISRWIHEPMLALARQTLLEETRAGHSVVVDGRIATTVVAADADARVNLTAPVSQRAQRQALREAAASGAVEVPAADEQILKARDEWDAVYVPKPRFGIPPPEQIKTDDRSSESVVEQILAQLTVSKERSAEGVVPEASQLIADLEAYGETATGNILSAGMQDRVLTLFPELKETKKEEDSDRLNHIFRAIHRFAQLTAGNMEALYQDIPTAAKTVDLESYTSRVEAVRSLYFGLEAEERQAVWLLVILHDIGTAETLVDHHLHSANLIGPLLRRANLRRDLIHAVKEAAGTHHDIGEVTLGELTPADLLGQIEGIPAAQRQLYLALLRLSVAADLAGWQEANHLTPYWLDRYAQFSNPDTLRQMDEEGQYGPYRLRQMGRPKMQVPLTPLEGQALFQAVDALVSPEERPQFDEAINRLLRLDVAPSYVHDLAAADPTYRSFVKLLRLFAHVALSTRQEPFEQGQISSFVFSVYGLSKEERTTVKRPALDRLVQLLAGVPDQLTTAQTRQTLEGSNWSSFFGIPLTFQPGRLVIDPKLMLYLQTAEEVRTTYARARGYAEHLSWQIEEAALDYTGQPALRENTSQATRERSQRAQQILRWIYRQDDTREDFIHFLRSYPVGHTFRNRVTPAALVMANYLAVRPLNDRQILAELPSTLFEGNETLAQHPWFGEGVTALPEQPPLARPDKDRFRILVVGVAEKADPRNSGFRYLREILESAGPLSDLTLEWTGNDIWFQERIHRFDGRGFYEGEEPGIVLGPAGLATDPTTGVRWIKLDGKGDGLMVDPFTPSDAGRYDLVLVSRVAVQYQDYPDRVARLRENAKRYLAPDGLLLFDTETTDHLEVIRQGQDEPEPVTIPFQDNWAFERRIRRLAHDPGVRERVAQAHRLAERFADRDHPVYPNYQKALALADPQDSRADQIIEILTADVPQTGLEEMSVRTALQELVGVENLVSAQRWSKRVMPDSPNAPSLRAKATAEARTRAKGAVQTIVLAARHAGIDVDDTDTLKAFIVKNFGIRRFLIAGGKGKRFGGEDPFVTKQMFRPDGTVPMMKQAREASGYRFEGVQDVVVVNDRTIYHMFKEKPLTPQERGRTLKALREELPESLAWALGGYDQNFENRLRQEGAGQIIQQALRVELEELLDLVMEIGREELHHTRSVLSSYVVREDQAPVVRGRDLKSFIVKLGLRLDADYPNIEANLREHILDETGFLVVRHWIEEARDETGVFGSLIDSARQEELVGNDAILALTRLEGPGGGFRYGVEEVERRGLQDQARFTFLIFADRPTFGLDDYPNVFLGGYLAAINQMQVRTPDGSAPLFDPAADVVDSRILELPVVTVASKSPIDKYEGRSPVWMMPAQPGAPQQMLASAIKEYHGLTDNEQRQIIEGFEWTRRTGEPHHHLDGGVFVFDMRWVLDRLVEWRRRYPRNDKGRFVYYQTDLIKMAYEEYLRRVTDLPQTMPMTRNIAVGINAPGGAGKPAEAHRYADRRNSNMIRRLRKLGVQVAKGSQVSITSRDGDLNPDRDLPKIFEAGLEEPPQIQGEVWLDPSVRIGPGVILDGTRAPVSLRSGTTVLAGAKLTGPVTATQNTWIGPGAEVEDAVLDAQVVVPGERMTGQLLRARAEALHQLTRDPRHYFSESVRHYEVSAHWQGGFWRGAYKPTTERFTGLAGFGRAKSQRVLQQMERLYHHPVYQVLNPTEIYRYLFALVRFESRRRDPFARPETNEAQAVMRRLAGIWMERIQQANGDRAQLRALLNDFLEFVTLANIFDHQSGTARTLIDEIQKALRKRLSATKKMSRVMDLIHGAVADEWAVDDRGEIARRILDVPPGTFVYWTDNLEEAEADAAFWLLLGGLGHRVVVAAKDRLIFSDIARQEVEAQVEAIPELRSLQERGLLRVISSGSDVYGTPLHLASEDLLDEIRRPDLRAVIGKGQGNLYASAARNPLTFPFVSLHLIKGMTAIRVAGMKPPKGKVPAVAAYLPPGMVANQAIAPFDPEDPEAPIVAVGSLIEAVEARQRADQDYRSTPAYQQLSQLFGAGLEEMETLLRQEENRTGRTRGQILQGRLHPEAIRHFLDQGGIERMWRRRAAERYDVIVIGGGTAGRMAAQALGALGYRVLIVTLGSDNGGVTQDRIEQLQPRFGWTFPVGDVTNGLIGFLTPLKQKLLNIRGLDPSQGDMKQHVAEALGRIIREHPDWRQTDPDLLSYAVELLNLAEAANTGILPHLPSGEPLSTRHELFSGLMAATGAYDADRKRIDPDRFEAGLYLFERAFGLPGRVIPNTVDPQTLVAEWDVIDPETGTWLRADGQVEISLIPDEKKRKVDGSLAAYRHFGFKDPVSAYPGLVEAIRNQLKPGGVVYYGFSSAVVSRSPQVMIRAVAEALAREDVAKVWLGNVTWNNETAFMEWTDEADFHEMATGLPLAETMDYMVVNSEWPHEAALGEARGLAEALEGSYPEALEAADQAIQETGGDRADLAQEAIKRLSGVAGIKNPVRQLLLGILLSDWGDNSTGWKFRGGRPLGKSQSTALQKRGLTLLELPFLRLGRSPMRLGYGADRRDVNLPLPIVDPAQFRLIDKMVRGHFAQKSGLEEGTLGNPDLERAMIESPTSNQWHQAFFETMPTGADFFWWFPAARTFIKDHPQVITEDFLTLLCESVSNPGFSRFHRHAAFWLLSSLASEPMELPPVGVIRPEYELIVSNASLRLAWKDDAQDQPLIRELLSDEGITVHSLAMLPRQGANAGTYRAEVAMSPGAPSATVAVKIIYPIRSYRDRFPTFFGTFADLDREDLEAGQAKRLVYQELAGDWMARLLKTTTKYLAYQHPVAPGVSYQEDPPYSGPGLAATFPEIHTVALTPHVLVEEFVEGEDLGYLVERGEHELLPDATRAARYAYEQIWAHTQGFAASDPKPTNVVVWQEAGQWRAKVVDLIEFDRKTDAELRKQLDHSLPLALARVPGGQEEIHQTFRRLESEPWLAAWNEAFQGFAEMASERPELFDSFGLLIDQSADGLGQHRLEVVIPHPERLNDDERGMTVRYLGAILNNAAWLSMKQPKDTAKSHAVISLSGAWAQRVNDWLKNETRLIESLSPTMLYGPVSVEVVGALPPATTTAATTPVAYAQVNGKSFNPRAGVPIVGVDLGGTNLKISILQGGRMVHGEVIADWRAQEAEVARVGLARFLVDQIRKRLSDADIQELPQVIGMSWPGPVRTPKILGSVSIETFLAGLIDKVNQGELSGDESRLRAELEMMEAGRFMAALGSALDETEMEEVILLPYRDAFAEAFGVAVASYHPAFTGKARSAVPAPRIVIVTSTLGTGVAIYLVEPDGRIARDTLLYELGRLVISMDPSQTKPNRSTGLYGTLRQFFSNDAVRLDDAEHTSQAGEALAMTALVLEDALGAGRMTLSGGNARLEIVTAAEEALKWINTSTEQPTSMHIELSPVAGLTGAEPIYTPSIGAGWAALADSFAPVEEEATPAEQKASAGLEELITIAEDTINEPGFADALASGRGTVRLPTAEANRLFGAPIALITQVSETTTSFGPEGLVFIDDDLIVNTDAFDPFPTISTGPTGTGTLAVFPEIREEDLVVAQTDDLTQLQITTALNNTFAPGQAPRVIMAGLEDVQTLTAKAIVTLWTDPNLPDVVMIGIVVQIKNQAGETFQLIVAA